MRSATTIHVVDKSMCILMFVENASKWALKLHSKLVFQNDKILRFQNRAVAACFTTIFWNTRDLHHPNGGLTCNFNGAIARLSKSIQFTHAKWCCSCMIYHHNLINVELRMKNIGLSCSYSMVLY